MPELPEVEAVARALAPRVTGRTIRRCRVIHAIAVRPPSGRNSKKAQEQFERTLPGQKIGGVRRLGKYLILELSHGILIMHFRLDGQLVWLDSGPSSGHIDVALEMDGGTLGFVDPRHFGRVQWAESPEAHAGLRTLGMDPFSSKFTEKSFAEILKSSRSPLKTLLMNQRRIAGLGNIYSNEALWRARLDPRRPAYRVKSDEARRLHKAIGGILHRALECCLNPAPDFRDPTWWFKGLEKILCVYGRAGKPCRRCGNSVRRIVQGGRSTFACFACQK